MLQNLLSRLDAFIPHDTVAVDALAWPEITSEISAHLYLITQQLMMSAEVAMPKRVVRGSKEEFLMPSFSQMVVAEYRLRPGNRYYAGVNRRVPRPEDPRGDDATGVEISMNVCRGFPGRPAFFSVDFQIWGGRERAAFARLLHDHHYLVQALVEQARPQFVSACPFDNVDAARRPSAFDKLVLYYENENDPENMFALQREFDADASEAEIARALAVMLAFFDATLGYGKRVPQRDLLLDHLHIARAGGPVARARRQVPSRT